MGLRESFQSFRGYLSLAPNGSSRMQKAVADANTVSRQHRPYGPEATPMGLPSDLPVFKSHGFRHRPRVSWSDTGGFSLLYAPRAEFKEVASFYEELLPAFGWLLTEVHDDSGHDFHARRFEVEKGSRRGSIAVEETRQDLGLVERRVVTVSVDMPQ